MNIDLTSVESIREAMANIDEQMIYLRGNHLRLERRLGELKRQYSARFERRFIEICGRRLDRELFTEIINEAKENPNEGDVPAAVAGGANADEDSGPRGAEGVEENRPAIHKGPA